MNSKANAFIMGFVHSECTLSLHMQSLLKRFFCLGGMTREFPQQRKKKNFNSGELPVMSTLKICSNSLAQVILQGEICS